MTRTNGKGVLKFEPEITKMILNASTEKHRKMHVIRFDYDFLYCSPYNTTDTVGLFKALQLLRQISNKIKVQFFFDIE